MLDELLPDEPSDAERDLAPSVDVPDEADVDPRLRRQFWLLVLVFNVALLAASVGAMLAAFRGQWDTGGSLLAAGAILGFYGYYKYRVYANAADADRAADADVTDAAATGTASDSDSTAAPAETPDTADKSDTDSGSGALADLDARGSDDGRQGSR